MQRQRTTRSRAGYHMLSRLSAASAPRAAASAPRRMRSTTVGPSLATRRGATATSEGSASCAGPCVCTVGDELLYGERESNGNERFLLRTLHARGTPAAMAAQLPDDPQTIADFIRFAQQQRYSPIFVAGGLGGTHDDKTREAIALALNRRLVKHTECFQILEQSFGARGIEFTAQRQRMADLPEGCDLIANPIGAPGFSCEGVFAFPGFPSMLQPMVEAVLEAIDAASAADSGATAGQLRTEQQVFPCSEGVISQLVEEFAAAHPQLRIGIYPSDQQFGKQCKLVLRYRSATDGGDAVLEWNRLLRQCKQLAAEYVKSAQGETEYARYVRAKI